MKLHIQLEAGSRKREWQLEFPGRVAAQDSSGQLKFHLDREELEADWAEIAPGVYSILLCGRSHEARVTTPSAETTTDKRWLVSVGTRNYLVEVCDPRQRRHAAPAAPLEGPQEILAPMPGKIIRILVKENQEVAQGAGLLVIEAMKMQNELRTPRAGRVEKIYVAEAAGVETGSRLIRLA